MDRIASRKLHLSPEQAGVYDKANKLFDEHQNDVTFMLAQEYLEKGKIDPKASVVEFLKKKGIKGYKIVRDEQDGGTREVYEPTDEINVEEEKDHFAFPCLIEVDNNPVVVKILVEKMKGKEDKESKESKETPKDEKSSQPNSEEHLINWRSRR